MRKHPPLIEGIVLAIGELWQAAEPADKDVRCVLCGFITRDGAPFVSHMSGHVRRGDLEAVHVDGVVFKGGASETGWQGSHIGYRTPGAACWYAVEIITQSDRTFTLPYDRGECPKWGSLALTQEQARKNCRHTYRPERFEFREVVGELAVSNG